tara:strand:- start:718 stop:966 length:249 start_codon:yes stop_codon:yes gene_type:complete
MQIGGIGDAKARILIDPSMFKSVSLKQSALWLESIKQRRPIPTSRKERWAIPLAAQYLKKGFIDLNKTLTFKKSQWVLQLQL